MIRSTFDAPVIVAVIDFGLGDVLVHFAKVGPYLGIIDGADVNPAGVEGAAGVSLWWCGFARDGVVECRVEGGDVG